MDISISVMARNNCFYQMASTETRGTSIYFVFWGASAQNVDFADICKNSFLRLVSNIRGRPAENFTDLETSLSVQTTCLVSSQELMYFWRNSRKGLASFNNQPKWLRST